jgi:hypothetical protein
VGAFAARAPFDDLAVGAVVAGGPATAGRELRVAAVVTNLVAVGIATPPDFAVAVGVLATPPDFAVAVGVLATLTAGLSSLLPAFYATRLDPVNVMRTP